MAIYLRMRIRNFSYSVLIRDTMYIISCDGKAGCMYSNMEETREGAARA